MKQIYNFEKSVPPRLTEADIRNELERRTLRRQILLLRIASLLCCLCIALFAFFIFRDSVVVAAISLIMFTLTLIGNGMISLVFHKYGMCDHK